MNNLVNENIIESPNNYWIALNKDLQQLRDDPAFQRLILKGYFVDRAVDATSMLAHDTTRKTNARGELIEELNAISFLQRYFANIEALGYEPTEEELAELEDEV